MNIGVIALVAEDSLHDKKKKQKTPLSNKPNIQRGIMDNKNLGFIFLLFVNPITAAIIWHFLLN